MGQTPDLAVLCLVKALFFERGKCVAEEADSDAVVLPHAADRFDDNRGAAVATKSLELLVGPSHEPLCSPQVAQSVFFKKLVDKLVQVGVDKAGLGEHHLWGPLAVGLGVRRKMFIENDSRPLAASVARVHRQPFKTEINLDVIGRQLHSDVLSPVPVRDGVRRRLYRDCRVGMDLRRLPLNGLDRKSTRLNSSHRL